MKPLTHILPLFAALLFSSGTLANGPKKVASLDRGLWPYKLDSSQAYNLASQHEIKRFAQIIATHSLITERQVQQFTQIENVNLDSVRKWLSKTQQQLLINYNNAAKLCSGCVTVQTWEQLTQSYEPDQLDALALWRIASGEFYKRYLYEQVRLAALFPRITSEIDKLTNDELDGSEFNDNEFLLTFDDGPSQNGNTQALTYFLNEQKIHGFFFVLGERLAQHNQKVDQTYKNQCLASHGYQHKVHPKWDKWRQSISDTQALLSPIVQGPAWYRPPYGQRTLEQLNYLTDSGSKLMLWNIDSQDWNTKLSQQQVQDRVITLMLLWRKGIILHHDINKKSVASVQGLSQLQKQAEYRWLDCREMKL